MTVPTQTFQNWKRGKLHGLKVLRKPPVQKNPSVIAQKPIAKESITLATVWPKTDRKQADAEPLERPGARRSHPPYDWHDGLNGDD